MNAYKLLAIVALAALPLASLTVTAFSSTGKGARTQVSAPAVPRNVLAVRDKATAALQGKAEAAEAAAKDPAGFREKIDGPAAKAAPYSVATTLAEAEAASAATDPRKVENALAHLEDAQSIGGDLLPEIEKRQRRLRLRRTWLTNRLDTAEALTNAEKIMNGPQTVAGAEECLKLLLELRRTLPNAPADEDEETTDSLTKNEAEKTSDLRTWAEGRRAFLLAKAKHASLHDASSENLAALVEEWDRFLAVNGRPGVLDRDECVPEARRLRTETRLALLWATAVAQKTPATLAPAVLHWLDEPRNEDDSNGSDAMRFKKGADLMRTWLDSSLPPVPAAIKSLDDMKEGTVDRQQDGKRFIAIFEPVPGRGEHYYRWWYSAAKRRDLPLGEDSGFLKQPPFEPRYKDWLARYSRLRDDFVNQGGFMADADSFVTACRSLAKEYVEHTATPALDPDNAFDRAAAGWDTNVFEPAARVASEFQSACRESGLTKRLRTAAP